MTSINSSGRLRRAVVAALLLGTLVVAVPATTSTAAPAAEPVPQIDLPPRPTYEHERLMPSLQDDLAGTSSGPGAAVPHSRTAAGADLVTVVVQTTDVDAARRAVADVGGTVTGEVADLVQADVPASGLGVVSEAPGVILVREPHLARADALSEGVAEMGASSWQTAGWVGTGTKVAIVDVGFSGYNLELGTELPASVETDFSRCSGFGDTPHGTAVAEIIHDTAPNAALLLVCVETDVDFVSALSTLAGKGVDVVNGSIGFNLTGRGDGSGGPGTPGGAVAALRQQGVLYVASAGNYGQHHFHTTAAGDTDGPGANDFVNITSDKVLQFLVAPSEEATVSVQWDAWPTTFQDFDVYASNETCGTFGIGEEIDQTSGIAPPIEQLIVANCTGSPQLFSLVVNRYSGGATPRIDFFFDGAVIQIEEFTDSALPEPATSPAVLAVGAHCHATGANQPYSSRGPTIDGRTKPDVSGPDAGSNSWTGPASGCTGGFTGTSAASPHVAGAAALLLGANPGLDVAELEQLIKDRSQDAGPAGADNAFGAGRVRLGGAGSAAVPTPQPLTAVPPLRLFDSRPGTLGASEAAFGAQGRTTPLPAGGEVAIQVADIAGIPTDATAVVLNVTATGPTQSGWITVHPGGTVPTASNLNFVPGQTVAAHVTATVGADRRVRFFNSHGSTDLVVDITGWYGPSGGGNARFTPLPAPARAFDSRDIGTGFAEGPFGPSGATTKIPPGQQIEVQLAGLGGIPADASAVVVNLTVTDPTQAGWLTLFPTGTAAPLASSLNFAPGQTVANLAVMPVGTGGKVTVFNSHGSSHVVIDVIGWFKPGTGAGYVALDPPTRDLDSRFGNGPRLGALFAGEVHRLPVGRYYGVPADAAAVLLSVTAVFPTQSGWFTIYPGTSAAPLASNLNFVAGGVVPNAVISALGTDGTVAFLNARGTTHAVSDLTGYFLDPANVPVGLTSPP